MKINHVRPGSGLACSHVAGVAWFDMFLEARVYRQLLKIVQECLQGVNLSRPPFFSNQNQ